MLPAILLKLILPYLLPVLFTAFVAISESYRLRDAAKYSKEWHQYKGYYQATFFTLVAVHDFWYACIMAAGFWIVHDIVINVFGFGLHWYYKGQSARLDKAFKTFTLQFIFKVLLLLLFVAGKIGWLDCSIDYVLGSLIDFFT